MSEHTQAVPPPEPTQAMPRGARFARRAGASVLILAALATGRVVTTAYEDDEGIGSPFLVGGTVGRPVDLRFAEVTALDVRGSKLVTPPRGDNLKTPGVFLVIPMKIVTKGKPGEVRYAAVEDRQGRTYLANGTRSAYAPGASQPGIARYASVLVEVPKDAVEGAHLRVSLNSLDTRRDDMADIDLGLTAADANAWAADEAGIRLTEPADTPPPVPADDPAGAVGTGDSGEAGDSGGTT